MNYVVSDDGLLDFSSCATEAEKMVQSWNYFNEQLINASIVAYDGIPVRGFTQATFQHIVSGSSNKYDTALDHDIRFKENRASCLPLIKQVLGGELKSRLYRVAKKHGKKTTMRRVLTVIELAHQYYVVVLDEVRDTYTLRTAFPSDKSYYDTCIAGKGVNMGVWG